jgi:hypothetical protein
MSATIWVRERVTCPTLEQVETYLRARGWKVAMNDAPWRVWMRGTVGVSVDAALEVPDAERRDWPRWAREAIACLATFENRSERAIALEMLGETP